MLEERRLGVIGIVLEKPPEVQAILNEYISEAGEIIVGRMGIPYRERNVAVLALLVDGTTDQINTLTGRLGSLPGVNVRAAVTKK
ncbi:MAG: TM1266 family iron-only hydrogenase system putative regulator [Bacteroidota bacterium]